MSCGKSSFNKTMTIIINALKVHKKDIFFAIVVVIQVALIGITLLV